MSERLPSPYRGYDVLAKWDSPSWNDQTRKAIALRLTKVPERRFFSEAEWALLDAVADRVVPQPDRNPKIPIVPWIDQLLARNGGEGYRYEDMPPMQEAWRRGLAAIESESLARHDRAFDQLAPAEQDEVLRAIQAGDVKAPDWQRLPPRRFFLNSLLRELISVYYSHPDAWSEIGFGGPASPRGYVRLGRNARDPWEAEEAG